MEWVKLVLGFLKEVIPTLTTFIVGRKSKELENIKEENKKLKEYKKINDREIQSSEVYDAQNWN